MLVSGAVAVVLGGARGIGKEYVRALLQKGAKVCCGDVLADEGERLEREFHSEFGTDNFFYGVCNITSDLDVKDLFGRTKSRYGHIDIFVNAAVCVSEDDWKKTLDVNVTGMTRAVHMALKHMSKDQKGGRGGVIILTSSLFAFYPFLASPTYGGTCGMAISLVKSWGHPTHFETTGIRFNVICPGIANTKMWNAFNKDGNMMHCEEAKQELNKFKMITLGQCAQGLLTLLENDSLNGESMVVSATKGNFIDTTYQQYLGLQ